MSTTAYRNLLDEELLYRVVQRQDQEAMNMLYKRYAHLALGCGLKYLDYHSAEDVVQQVFVKIWQSAAQLKIKTFKPWLFTVVKNECLMILRKSSPMVAMPENGFDFVEYEDLSHHKMEQEQVLNILDHCLSKLQVQQKQCVELFYRGQKTYQEIASSQSMTEKQVKSYLQNGRRNLKLCFSQNKNAQ